MEWHPEVLNASNAKALAILSDAGYLLGYLGMPGEELVLERAFADFPERKAEPEASFLREFVRKAFSEIGR